MKNMGSECCTQQIRAANNYSIIQSFDDFLDWSLKMSKNSKSKKLISFPEPEALSSPVQTYSVSNCTVQRVAVDPHF